MSTTVKGLKRKYIVSKTDGSPVRGRYFVLKMDSKDSEHAAASRAALKAYAQRIRFYLPELADDIVASLDSYDLTGRWDEWDKCIGR